MVVRVIRVLEYEFADHQAAERHMANWAVPANGVHDFGTSHTQKTRVRVRSATMFPAFAEDALPDPESPVAKPAGMWCCGVCGRWHDRSSGARLDVHDRRDFGAPEPFETCPGSGTMAVCLEVKKSPRFPQQHDEEEQPQ